MIPNPWDVGSARYLQHLGFPALATTSAGFAFSQGLPDSGDAVVLQEEDANYDGKIDRAFQGTAAVPVKDPKAPPALPALDCGPADPFWAGQR